MNKSEKEIIAKYDELKQEIRDFISLKLMDTNEDEKKECDIILETPGECGISDLEKPLVKFLWQVPTSGEICVEFYDDSQVNLDDIPVDWQIQIVKYLW